jgi:hypothetical protein
MSSLVVIVELIMISIGSTMWHKFYLEPDKAFIRVAKKVQPDTSSSF